MLSWFYHKKFDLLISLIRWMGLMECLIFLNTVFCQMTICPAWNRQGKKAVTRDLYFTVLNKMQMHNINFDKWGKGHRLVQVPRSSLSCLNIRQRRKNWVFVHLGIDYLNFWIHPIFWTKILLFDDCQPVNTNLNPILSNFCGMLR